MSKNEHRDEEAGWFDNYAASCLRALLHLPVTCVSVKRLRSPVPGISEPHVLIIQCLNVTVYLYNGNGDIRTTGGLWPNAGWEHAMSYMGDDYEVTHYALRDPHNPDDEGKPRYIGFSRYK